MTKVSIIIYKIVFTLYLIACIGTEIWHVVTLHNIGDYNDYGVHPDNFIMIYSNAFYFFGNLLLITFTLYLMNEYNRSLWNYFVSYFYTQFVIILMMGCRYVIPHSHLGQIPFNCNFNHYLPDNIKIACKARFISCTMGFSTCILPFIPLLINGSYYLLKSLRSSVRNYLQHDLFVL
ncbi:hypothetical protein RclHR1_03950008 [Rhizophagus clarus]|uniref:Uncharacterized protein n=1 Tax=Rhizophagus clarus TaxID=94130 RepID=A0A2Z6RW26_9GLOM|nr:hypothetical protein RclHR1_03950008 [Rhizophagus clarus]GES92861.1 hypothetical protein GLOIN_2v618243 [Rhizophagus clarus]